jgi:hypothetical protein
MSVRRKVSRVARKAPRSFSTLSLPGLSMITVYAQRRGCQRGAFSLWWVVGQFDFSDFSEWHEFCSFNLAMVSSDKISVPSFFHLTEAL